MKSLPEFYPPEYAVPERLDTAVLTLTPLKPDHVQLDYAALMQSKETLRLWSGTPWPQDDFSVADNLKDLEWHWAEHKERIAFTYTVLNPAGDECLGCVYIKHLVELVNDRGILKEIGEKETAVRFWVAQPYLEDDLDEALLGTLIDWFDNDWSFSRVLFHTRSVNGRQLELFARVELHHIYTLNLPRRGGPHQFWGKIGFKKN